MFEWISRNKVKIILSIFLFLVGVPFLIHCLYKINLSESFWVSAWSAGEFLDFYGSVLSFIATIILSLLALWQNEVIREESNKHTMLLEEMEKNKCCPFFAITFLRQSIEHSDMEVEIKNITDNIAIDIVLSEVNGTLNREDALVKLCGFLTPQSSLTVNLENGFMDQEKLIEMEIKCKDIYGDDKLFAVQGHYDVDAEEYLFVVTNKGRGI